MKQDMFFDSPQVHTCVQTMQKKYRRHAIPLGSQINIFVSNNTLFYTFLDVLSLLAFKVLLFFYLKFTRCEAKVWIFPFKEESISTSKSLKLCSK